MKDSSNADTLHSQVIFLKMRQKTTEELISIWVENDRKVWSKEEFDAVQTVLLERLDKLPEQKMKQEAGVLLSHKKKYDSGEKVAESLLSISSYNDFRAAVFVFCIVCLLFGSVVVAIVNQNTKAFWKFAKTTTSSDIEKIEIQRMDPMGNDIGEIITISDEGNVSGFVSALSTMQEYRPNHPAPNYEVGIKVWRANRNIFNYPYSVEFECYTMNGEGNTLFVGDVWIKPGIYSYGNGNAKFLAPDLVNWLEKNGMPIRCDSQNKL